MRVVYFLPRITYFTEGMSGRTSHAHGFLSGLAKNNIDCLLVSGPGYKELHRAGNINNLVISGSPILRINMLWVAYSCLRIVSDRSVNMASAVLVVRYSVSVAMITSLIFGLFWKGRTVYEVNSVAYHQLKNTPGWLLMLVLAVEKRIIGCFDAALCVSRNIKVDIERGNIQYLVLPNGSSSPAVHLQDSARKSPRFVYLGAYQPYYDFAQLFRCFIAANSPGAHLHIYGDVRRYSAEFPQFANHEKIRFKGRYVLPALIEDGVLSRKDIFVLPNGRNSMARIGSPTKLFEYLSFGSRIVYQNYGQASDILNGLASVYGYHDDESLIRILKLLADQYNDEFPPPVTVTQYLETYTWEARVAEFHRFLRQLS